MSSAATVITAQSPLDEQEGISFYCPSCKAPCIVSWTQIDVQRQRRASAMVLCQCRRWIGNVEVGAAKA